MSKSYRTFKCHKCKNRHTKVISVDHRADHVTRYRLCLDCGTKFKTEEKYVKYQEPLQRNVKLTPEKVKEIRNSKLSMFELSFKHDVDISTIQAVKSRKTWKHID